VNKKCRAIRILMGVSIINISLFYSVLMAGETTIIKIGAVAPEGTAWHDTSMEFKRLVEEGSEGKLKIVYYAGAVMGDEPDMIRKIKLNQLQGGAFTELGLTSIVPEIRVLNLILTYNDYDEWDYIRNNIMDDISKACEQRGFKFIGFTEIGPVYFFSKLRVETLAEIGKAKFWVWAGDPWAKEMAVKGLGVTPVMLSLPEVMTALQTGMVDTFYGPPYALLALQWYTKAKYMTTIPAGFVSGGTLVSKGVFDKFSPEIKKLVMESWAKVFPKLKDTVRELNKKTYEEFKNQGIEAIDIRKEDYDLLKSRSEELNIKTAQQLGFLPIYNKVQNLLKEYRSKKGK